MASPQVENGFLRLSNELAEALARTPLSGAGLRIVPTVIRECYGRNGGRKMAPLSYGMIAAATRLGLRTIQREVGRLLKANVLQREAKGRRRTYGVQKNYELWVTGDIGQLTDDQSTDDQLTEGESVNQATNISVNRPTGQLPIPSVSGGLAVRKKEEVLKKESFAFAGKHLRLTSTQLQTFKGAFPSLDVEATLRKADAWCVANPDRAPRKRHARFVHTWLTRERPAASGNNPAQSPLSVGAADLRRQLSAEGHKVYERSSQETPQ